MNTDIHKNIALLLYALLLWNKFYIFDVDVRSRERKEGKIGFHCRLLSIYSRLTWRRWRFVTPLKHTHTLADTLTSFWRDSLRGRFLIWQPVKQSIPLCHVRDHHVVNTLFSCSCVLMKVERKGIFSSTPFNEIDVKHNIQEAVRGHQNAILYIILERFEGVSLVFFLIKVKRM